MSVQDELELGVPEPAGLTEADVCEALYARYGAFHGNGPRFAVAAHSYAETYSTLTRKGGPAPFDFSPAQAWAALESLRAVTDLVGLSPAQTLAAVRGYADGGGVGPRLYDRLIGEAAVAHGVPHIVTWNAAHMRGLFPRLAVSTPVEFLAARAPG